MPYGKDGGWRAEGRGLKTEDGRQRTEDGGRKAEGGRRSENLRLWGVFGLTAVFVIVIMRLFKNQYLCIYRPNRPV
jgi:hypothetical protein